MKTKINGTECDPVNAGKMMVWQKRMKDLYETLHHINTLVEDDVEVCKAMISLLGDLAFGWMLEFKKESDGFLGIGNESQQKKEK